ncbi:hypothetical protein [Amycolatopsis sp. NPDC059657]|uniref:hypothetical protein n=1 Tax=Amycolatopsis sp. NPDC059657 TaxID=3346899 RepID=UPI00366A6E16
MAHPHAMAIPFAAGITASVFPAPATAIRTNDPVAVAGIRGFARYQAAAARTIAAMVLGVTAPATERLIEGALNAATTWRYRVAEQSGETELPRYRMPLTMARYRRIGYVGKAREGATWHAPTGTYFGGLATPAHHTLGLFGRYAVNRFAEAESCRDTLRNQLVLGNGSVIAGGALLRRSAAADVADLVRRSAALRGETGEPETGGNAMYAVSAPPADSETINRAATTALADALNAAADNDIDTASRLWAFGAYCLYQAPRTARGSDAACRVALAALGAIALRRIPWLPHDIDLRAQVLEQTVFVEQLIATHHRESPATTGAAPRDDK